MTAPRKMSNPMSRKHRALRDKDIALMRAYLQGYGCIPDARKALRQDHGLTFNFSNWLGVLEDILMPREPHERPTTDTGK